MRKLFQIDTMHKISLKFNRVKLENFHKPRKINHKMSMKYEAPVSQILAISPLNNSKSTFDDSSIINVLNYRRHIQTLFMWSHAEKRNVDNSYSLPLYFGQGAFHGLEGKPIALMARGVGFRGGWRQRRLAKRGFIIAASYPTANCTQCILEFRIHNNILYNGLR